MSGGLEHFHGAGLAEQNGVGPFLAALAEHIATLIVARTLQGAGTAAGMVVGHALVQDLLRGRHARA